MFPRKRSPFDSPTVLLLGIVLVGCPEALISLYWTAEKSGEKIVCVDFGNAGAVNEHIGPDGPQAVRCVRGSLP